MESAPLPGAPPTRSAGNSPASPQSQPGRRSLNAVAVFYGNGVYGTASRNGSTDTVLRQRLRKRIRMNRSVRLETRHYLPTYTSLHVMCINTFSSSNSGVNDGTDQKTTKQATTMIIVCRTFSSPRDNLLATADVVVAALVPPSPSPVLIQQYHITVRTGAHWAAWPPGTCQVDRLVRRQRGPPRHMLT